MPCTLEALDIEKEKGTEKCQSTIFARDFSISLSRATELTFTFYAIGLWGMTLNAPYPFLWTRKVHWLVFTNTRKDHHLLQSLMAFCLSSKVVLSVFYEQRWTNKANILHHKLWSTANSASQSVYVDAMEYLNTESQLSFRIFSAAFQ